MTAQRADELFFEALPAGTPEERALALAFKRGERGAYEQIHERYEARVLSVCRRMLGDPDDAQEAAQEAFLRVYQGLPRFNGRYRLGAWIVRITTNVCLDQLRARSRRPSDPAPLEILDLESPFADDTDPQILFLRHAEGRRVRKVLDSLPPLHRAAIVLRDFEGIPYSDIAETLGISEGQVKALLHRARKGFKRSWAANVASILLPAGVFKRWFKPWDLPSHASGNVGAVSQAAETAVSSSQQFASSAAQAVSACGGALQQCSQFMADKTAPVVAAVVVGTASVGAAVTAGRHDPVEPTPGTYQTSSEVITGVENERPTLFRKSAVATPRRVRTDNSPRAGSPAQAPAPSDVEPAPEPSPTPTPDPSDVPPAAEQPVSDPSTPPEGEQPNTAPDPLPLPAEPVGFNFEFGVSMASTAPPCACIQETTVISEKVKIREPGIDSLHQTISGSAAAAGTPTYGLRLTHGSDHGYDHQMDFSLWTSEGGYTYTASGVLVDRTRTDWGGWIYRYEGNYRLTGRPSMAIDMPERGSYSVELAASLRNARIVRESLFLTEETN